MPPALHPTFHGADDSDGSPGEPMLADMESRITPGLQQWVRSFTLNDGTPVLARPAVPADADLYPAFIARASADDLRLRFFGPVKELSPAFIARLTQFDRANAMAFVAIHQVTGEGLGLARVHADTGHVEGQFAIIVRTDYKGRGLGPRLMELLIAYARAGGLARLEGQVLAENGGMLKFARRLGFSATYLADEPHIVEVGLDLRPETPSALS